MAENDKPPAPPAEPDTSAPEPNPAIAEEMKPKLEATLAAVNAPEPADQASANEASAGEKEDGPSVYDQVREHAAASDPEHPTVREFAERRGLFPVEVFNPQTEQMEKHPCWQVKALMARFRQEGLHDDARLPQDVLELALHEALHGRV